MTKDGYFDDDIAVEQSAMTVPFKSELLSRAKVENKAPKTGPKEEEEKGNEDAVLDTEQTVTIIKLEDLLEETELQQRVDTQSWHESEVRAGDDGHAQATLKLHYQESFSFPLSTPSKNDQSNAAQ